MSRDHMISHPFTFEKRKIRCWGVEQKNVIFVIKNMKKTKLRVYGHVGTDIALNA